MMRGISKLQPSPSIPVGEYWLNVLTAFFTPLELYWMATFMFIPPFPVNETRFIGKVTCPVRRFTLFFNACIASGFKLNVFCSGDWLACCWPSQSLLEKNSRTKIVIVLVISTFLILFVFNKKI